MLKKLIRPHSILITVLILAFIWLVDSLRLNMHYLDPFNNGLKDYETTDIVYSYLSKQPKYLEKRIIIINSGKPDRKRLSQLIDHLHQAGTGVIGLDLLLSERTNTPADTLLQTSIRKAGNVVLACTLQDVDGDYNSFEHIVGVDTFFSNYANLGFVNFPANETKTLRLFSPREQVAGQPFPAFATQISAQAEPQAVSRLLARKKPVEYIYFIGNKDDFIRKEIDQVMDLEPEEARVVFQNKVVLVGYVPEDEWANSLMDRHYTPLNKNYSGKSIPDMFGVVLHANVISMILEDNYVIDTPNWIIVLLTILFCYLNVVLIHWIYQKFHESFHGITRALQGFEFLALFFITAALFYFFRVRFEFTLGIFALLLAYDIIMIYEHFLRNRVPLLERLPDQIKWQRKKGKKNKSIAEKRKKNPEMPDKAPEAEKKPQYPADFASFTTVEKQNPGKAVND